MTSTTLADLDRARRDSVVFAEVLIGQPLWPHQVEVVRSPARYRCLCAGRRSGKTRVFGVLALHRAFAVPRSKVLIVSAGDTSAKRMFADISGMASRSAHLAGSLIDESAHLMTLSNGSTIECVPSSIKAVRSAEADLLIVDEAGFVDQSVWEAAEPVVGARPGARVLIASTPWGAPEHFFRSLWRQGMSTPDAEVASWQWPTTANPQVDLVWLEGVRSRSPADYFAREYLAEWTDESGAYFSEAEIMACVADYELLDAAGMRDASPFVDGLGAQPVFPAVMGVDWGIRRDSNAVALVSPLEDEGLNDQRLGEGQRALYVPWIHGASGWAWHDFAGHLVGLCGAYRVEVIASEVNGVGDAATAILRQALQRERRYAPVCEVWTDNRRKQAGFGKLKALLARGLLVLPLHPELLKQLRGLEFHQLDSGAVRIAVPESFGHDDLAMALMQAISCVGTGDEFAWSNPGRRFGARPGQADAWTAAYRRNREELRHRVESGALEVVATTGGVTLPRLARPMRDPQQWFTAPAGRELGEAW